eukprot:358727-Chlamydomonas_euryale.AAC.13
MACARVALACVACAAVEWRAARLGYHVACGLADDLTCHPCGMTCGHAASPQRQGPQPRAAQRPSITERGGRMLRGGVHAAGVHDVGKGGPRPASVMHARVVSLYPCIRRIPATSHNICASVKR